jgi:HK97 family phage major capsid protein
MAPMTVEQLEGHLNTLIAKAVDPGMVEIKALKDQIDELKKTPPIPIQTKGTGVLDGKNLNQVGPDQYRLPGGSVINTNAMWAPTGKGFKRSSGIFESLGEEAEECMVKAMKDFKAKGAITLVTKDPLAMSATMSAQDDTSAALFVPEDVRYAILQFAPPGTIVWPRAQVWPMTTDNINWPKLTQDLTVGSEEFFGNVQIQWTEEGAEKPDTRPSFETLRLTCHEMSAYTEVTDTLLEDSAINLGNLLTQLFQGSYWHGTDLVFLRGMGATRPLGILNDSGVYTQSRIVANQLHFEDLVNMSTKMPSIFDSGSVWFMSKQCFNSLRKQKDSFGRPVIDLSSSGSYNDFAEGIAGYALGYPIVISDYKTYPLGTRGDVVLGNWKHYFIGERRSLSIEMSRHAVFRNNRTAFRTSARIGGMPEESRAFVVLDSTADATLAS